MIVLASAGLLLAATVAVWFVAAGARAAARLQIRFAAVLIAALTIAAAAMPIAAAAVALLVLPIAFGVLALAAAAGFARPLLAAPAALMLALCCLAGLAAAISGFAALSLAPAVLALVAIAAIFLRQFDAARPASLQGILSALCFLGAVSAFALEGTGAAMLLFAAAGLLGIALALARSDVAQEQRSGRDLRAALAIRGRRQI